MTTYIAGPMTGYPEFNYPAFKAAADALRAEGNKVASPTEHTDDEPPAGYNAERPYAYYLRCSLRMLLECEEIVLLPGWEASVGACLERKIAEALGMPIRELSEQPESDDEGGGHSGWLTRLRKWWTTPGPPETNFAGLH